MYFLSRASSDYSDLYTLASFYVLRACVTSLGYIYIWHPSIYWERARDKKYTRVQWVSLLNIYIGLFSCTRGWVSFYVYIDLFCLWVLKVLRAKSLRVLRDKRDLCICKKRPTCTWKETYVYVKKWDPLNTSRVSEYPAASLVQASFVLGTWLIHVCGMTQGGQCIYGKGPMYTSKNAKRPCINKKRLLYVWKETYVYMEKDLCIYEKRPMYVWKETYV